MTTADTPTMHTVKAQSATRILLATDGSEAAGRAASFAARTVPPGSAVRVLVVLSYDSYPYGSYGPLSDEREREERTAESVVRKAAGAVGAFERAGHTVTTVGRFGNAPEAIAREANEWAPDMVVLGRRALRGPARWLDSVSERALHRLKVPVLLVP